MKWVFGVALVLGIAPVARAQDAGLVPPVPPAAAGADATAPIVTTIVSNGPPELRVNVVIVSEGYTAAQMGDFRRDAWDAVSGFLTVTPFKEYARYFNFHRIEAPSAKPGVPDPAHAADSALGTTMVHAGDGSLPKVDAARVRAIAAKAPRTDVIVILANDRFRSWADDGYTIVAAHGWDRIADVTIHEVGHALGLLLDEYSELPEKPWDYLLGNGLVENLAHWTGWGPNLTTTRVKSEVPWKRWLDGKEVGLFEGGGHLKRLIFRPSEHCRMRETARPFCKVCREALVLRISQRAFPVRVATKRLDRERVRFEATTIIPGSSSVAWTRNGRVVAEGPRYLANRADLPWGESELVLVVTDRTPWVRDDPLELTTWRVRFRLDKGYAWDKGLRVEGPFAIERREKTGVEIAHSVMGADTIETRTLGISKALGDKR